MSRDLKVRNTLREEQSCAEFGNNEPDLTSSRIAVVSRGDLSLAHDQ